MAAARSVRPSTRVYSENTLRWYGERFRSTTSRVVVAVNGATSSRRPNARATSSAPKSSPRCESSTSAAPANRCAYAAGTRLPPCSQLTSSWRRRGRERLAVGERFAELLIDPREFGARRQQAHGLADPRRERAVAQVVLEHAARRRVERTAGRHRFDQMLP